MGKSARLKNRPTQRFTGHVSNNNGGHASGHDSEGRGFSGNAKKRQRRSTGGTSTPLTPSQSSELSRNLNSNQANQAMNVLSSPLVSKTEFLNQSTDEKLGTLFDTVTVVNTIYSKSHDLESRLDTLEKDNSEMRDRIRNLEYQSIDQEARSRRLNLIFRGIDETINENCEELVKTFLKEELGIQIADDIKIQRAHRLGSTFTPSSHSRQQRSRPIIVCFAFEEDINLILKNAARLKGKPQLSISRDFPLEIAKARSKLWERCKLEKSRNPPNSVYISYPAKLIVMGRTVQDEFPNWNHFIRQPRTRKYVQQNTHQQFEQQSDHQVKLSNKHENEPLAKGTDSLTPISVMDSPTTSIGCDHQPKSSGSGEFSFPNNKTSMQAPQTQPLPMKNREILTIPDVENDTYL